MTATNPLSGLYPRFSSQIVHLLHRLWVAGLPFEIFCGYRSCEEQNRLYAQGRTVPGKIVTGARGGDSWHNYGLAADLVAKTQQGKPELSWCWDLKIDSDHDGRHDWEQMAEIARGLGLESGWYWETFPDPPHIQSRFGLTLGEARNLYWVGGLPSVWAAADKYQLQNH